MIELTLAEDIPGDIAKSGDTIILKDDGSYEIKKENIEKEKYKVKTNGITSEIESKKTPKEMDEMINDLNRMSNEGKETQKGDVEVKLNKEDIDKKIEKYLTSDKEKAWSILNKFYNNNHFDSTKLLKHVISKMAVCPDITEKFDDLMVKWMAEGEADVSPIEKIINSCKNDNKK